MEISARYKVKGVTSWDRYKVESGNTTPRKKEKYDKRVDVAKQNVEESLEVLANFLENPKTGNPKVETAEDGLYIIKSVEGEPSQTPDFVKESLEASLEHRGFLPKSMLNQLLRGSRNPMEITIDFGGEKQTEENIDACRYNIRIRYEKTNHKL